MKHTLIKLHPALVGCLLYTLCAPASASIVLTAQPDSATIAVGKTTDVSVLVSGLGANVAPSLGTFDIDVTFDPAALEYIGVQFGGTEPLGDQLDQSGLGSLSEVKSSNPGVVNLYELSLDDAATLNDQQADSFVLAIMRFRAQSLGISPIGIVVNALGDADGSALAAASQGSTIHVTAVPLGDGAYLFASGLVFVVVLGRRRRAIEISNSWQD